MGTISGEPAVLFLFYFPSKNRSALKKKNCSPAGFVAELCPLMISD